MSEQKKTIVSGSNAMDIIGTLDKPKPKLNNGNNVFAITLQPINASSGNDNTRHKKLIELSNMVMVENNLNSKIDLYQFLLVQYFKNKQ